MTLTPGESLGRLREAKPLVHQITNYVVMNETANATLALGALPVMAHAGEEVEEMARIDGPVFDKACVRFYAEIEWNGEPLLLQSRAMDDTGYVQPSKDALRKIRGVNSIYHNNGIQTWALKVNGEIENVEVG